MSTEEIVTGAEQELDEILKLREENKRLRETTVSREVYKKALSAIANGDGDSAEPVYTPTSAEIKADYEQRVKNISSGENRTNLDMAEDMLFIRDYVLSTEKKDIFLPNKGNLRQSDRDDAQNVADGIRAAVEYANGDPDMFNQFMGQHMQ